MVLLRGNPRYRSPGSDDGDAQRRSSCGGIVLFSSHWLEVVLKRSGVSLPTSTMLGLCGMVSRKLGGGCVLCCMRRGGGTMWRCGSIDGKSDDGFALI
jgi:hypothetical protein